MRLTLGLVLPMALSGCGSAPGTQPHDASAAGHEQMAQAEDREAAGHEHQAQAQPKRESDCPQRGCWTSSTSATEKHKEEAQTHRELAAKHRAASKALVDAEAQACAGLSEDDRDISPFYHREDISSVGTLEESVTTGKAMTKKTVGAKVVFRATPGMTAEWLQRLVDCHMARAAALGHAMPGMEYCPLYLKDVKATVASTGDGFAVDIRADDAGTVQEIIKRAESLKAR